MSPEHESVRYTIGLLGVSLDRPFKITYQNIPIFFLIKYITSKIVFFQMILFQLIKHIKRSCNKCLYFSYMFQLQGKAIACKIFLYIVCCVVAVTLVMLLSV